LYTYPKKVNTAVYRSKMKHRELVYDKNTLNRMWTLYLIAIPI